MIRYMVRRLLSLVLTLVLASLIIFFAMEVVPGDPASVMLGVNAQPETIAALRQELGLDVAKPVRYFNWFTGMLRGDFGTSYTYRTPVRDMIADRMVVSFPLALYALLLSTLIAFPAGIIAATKRGAVADTSIMGTTQLGIAIPNFWFAMILVSVFAIKLRWFSAGGFPGWENGLFTGLNAITLRARSLIDI